MNRIRLIPWNASEAEERAATLRVAGYEVDLAPLQGTASLRPLRDQPPAAFVIDLTRRPSHGREVALALRQYKATRHVPLVFVEGDPEKVARLRELLPDAIYTTWGRIRTALQRAIAHPPADIVVPESVLAGYSGTPLRKKLGIKEHTVVVLMEAPENFEATLGELPDGAMLLRQSGGRRDLTIWFTRSRKDLEHCLARMVGCIGLGGLWIVWPKKASGVDTDLTQALVRAQGLAAGLVDYKISAIDATWSGLKFAKRKVK
jgi:CheY-like chemotaxis protein